MKLADALRNPLPPVTVDPADAPCREEVFENPADAGEFVVPIRHTEFEPDRPSGPVSAW